MTSVLFEHTDILGFLAPVVCTPPISNVNHTFTNTIFLFGSKRCKQTDLPLITSELKPLYYVSFRPSDSLAQSGH